jgi:1-acyl-sn-glycerol-3-phosphate acyltransferase
VSRRKRGWALIIIAGLLRPLLLVLTKRRWRGQEHIPDGGFVFVANHISHIDPLLFAHFAYDNGVPPRFLAKQGVFKYPVIGRLLLATGQIPVRRGTTDVTSSFAGVVEAVEAGDGVIVYAEGSITRDPDLWPMIGKTGAARLALQTGCPVIPVAQWGANEVLPPYAKKLNLLPRKTHHVLAGPPVDLTRFYDKEMTPELLKEATEVIMAAITRQLEQIRGEKAPTTPYDPRRERIEQRRRTRAQNKGKQAEGQGT